MQLPFCKELMALEIDNGLIGLIILLLGSGDPGEHGEHGSLCLKLPDKLSIPTCR